MSASTSSTVESGIFRHRRSIESDNEGVVTPNSKLLECRVACPYRVGEATKADALIAEAEWIFCLDFNILSRTKKMEEKLKQAKAERILIDHHQEPQTEFFAYGVSDVAKSSTAEMVYDLIVDSGNADKINEAISECLYAGVGG